MSRTLKPSELAKVGDLERRIADLEKLVAQIPTRIGQSESPRSAQWIYQTSHTFQPGDVVVGSVAGWTLSTRSLEPSPGLCGVVERVVGNRFLVVTEGRIDTSSFSVQPTGYDLGGDLAIKPTGPTSAIVVQSTRTELVCVCFFDASTAGRLGRAVIGATTIDPDSGLCQGDQPEYLSVGIIKSIERGVPILNGGIYYAVIVGQTEGVDEFRITRMESDSPFHLGEYNPANQYSFVARFGKVLADGNINIIDPETSRYWTNATDAVIPPGMGDGVVCVPSTATEGDAAIFPCQFPLGLDDELTFTTGDIVPIRFDASATGGGLSFIVERSMNELRDVDRDTAPTDYDILTWRNSTKLWTPQTLYPPGGDVGNALVRTGAGPMDVGWGDGGGGISEVSLGMTVGHGIGFSDGTVGPKTGDSFTLDFLPIDGTAVGSNTIKGTFMCADGTEAAADQYPTQNPVWFPAASGRNALLVADASTALPTWKKAIEIGDTTNHGGTLKVWYASAKYWEVNASGVLTMYDSAAKTIEIDPVTNGIKYTFASGKYVQTSNAGATTWYQSALKYAKIDSSSVSLDLIFTSGQYISLASASASISAQYAVGVGCFMNGSQGIAYHQRGGTTFSVCDVATITTSTAAPTVSGVKGQMHFIY